MKLTLRSKGHVYSILRSLSIAIFTLSILFPVYGQQQEKSKIDQHLERKISFELTNGTLTDALEKLTKQTKIQFAYQFDRAKTSKRINVKAANESVSAILKKILAPYDLDFTIVEDMAVIHPVRDVKGNGSDVSTQTLLKGKILSWITKEPVAGVLVKVEGSAQETSSDENGAFALALPSAGSVITFSHVGYATKNVAFGGQTELYVDLETSVHDLEEVLVVGYGTQTARTVTGSISKIAGESIANLSTTSFDQQLAGRAAGVQVTLGSGNTNASPRVRIRGINSINNSRNPLWVVDGVPISTSGVGASTSTNALADINPDDILSIDVLKDGAATAIYGSRAANGVILITTKRGEKSAARVNYNSYYTISNPTKLPKLLNAEQFVEIANEKYRNSGVDEDPARLDDLGTDVDWLALVYNNNAFSQNHSLNITGGNDKTTYYTSLNYLKQYGVVKKNRSTRYNFRANIDHQINKHIKIGTNTSVSNVENIGFNTGSGLSSINAVSLVALPNVSPYDPTSATGYNLSGDGKSLGAGPNLQTIDDAFANILFTMNNDKYEVNSYRILNNTFGEVQILPGLKYRSQVSADINLGYDFYSLDARHGDGFSYNGLVQNTFIRQSLLNFQNYLTYNRGFAGHNIGLTAGNEIQRTKRSNAEAGGTDFSNAFFQERNLISGTYTNQTSSGSYSESAFLSYFARLNYDFEGRYILGLTIRNDGLSSLSKENRFGVFPGISAGWRVSDEEFWSRIGLSAAVPSLKFRASYGKVGNALSGFPYLSTYGAAPYGSLNGISVSSIGNPSLQWETSKKLDVGFDAGILNNRISIGFDWFRNEIDNMVMSVTYPNSYGIPGNSVSRNVGAMFNKGVEFTVGADAIQRSRFRWNINANFSKVKNEVTKLYGDEDLGGSSSLVQVGLPLNMMIGYDYAGVNKVNGNPMYYKADGRLVQGNIEDQLYYYAVSKEDGTLGEKTTLTDDDKIIFGNPSPTWYGGFINTFTYGRFSLEAFLRFSGGNKISDSQARSLLNQKFKNNGVEILDRWTPTNTDTDVPKLWYGKESFINLSPSNRWVTSGDYLRLQTATISYTFAKGDFRGPIGDFLSSARVYLQGQNIFTITKFKGIDPDIASESGSAGNSSPTIRSFSLGLNLSF